MRHPWGPYLFNGRHLQYGELMEINPHGVLGWFEARYIGRATNGDAVFEYTVLEDSMYPGMGKLKITKFAYSYHCFMRDPK
jgi:hypothetical protein